MKLSIVDYKSGNISSVVNSFKEVAKDKVNISVTSDINKTKSTEINIFIRKSFKVNLCGHKHFFDIHNIPREGGILLALK